MLKYIKNIVYEKNSMPSSQQYIKINISNNKNILEFKDNIYSNSIQKTKSVVISDELVIDFIDKLLRTVWGWKNEYLKENIIDGIEWKLKIQFTDGSEKYYCGKNDYPNNFEYLDKIKYDLISKAMTN